MSMERLAGTAPPEPSPPLAPADPGGMGGASPAMRLQILSTEHWSLLASRSLAWNESFSRAGMFLSALSGAIVALALVAQASAFGQGFTLFALVILPAVLFVGVTTFTTGASIFKSAICFFMMARSLMYPVAKIQCGACALICASAAEWSRVPMAYLSKKTTFMPRFFADFSISCAIASGKRSLRARIATRCTPAACFLTMSASGSVSVWLGVKVPKRYL
jgi:hypothetical protein